MQANTHQLNFGRAYLLSPDGKSALERRATRDLNCAHTKRGNDRAHVVSEHLLPTTLNYIQEQEPSALSEQFFKWKKVGKQKRRTQVDRDQPYAILLGVPRTDEEIRQRPLTCPRWGYRRR